MREADLPSPGFGSKSMHLRRVAANVISAVQIAAPRAGNGASSEAVKLKAFFDACSAAAATASKPNPVMTVTPATATLTVAAPTQQLTVAKGGSSGAVTYVSSNVAVATVNASGLVTRVGNGTCTIRVNMAEGTAHKAASRTVAITCTA